MLRRLRSRSLHHCRTCVWRTAAQWRLLRGEKVFWRRKNHLLPLRCGSAIASPEVVHRPRSQSPLQISMWCVALDSAIPNPTFSLFFPERGGGAILFRLSFCLFWMTNTQLNHWTKWAHCMQRCTFLPIFCRASCIWVCMLCIDPLAAVL